MSETKLIEVPDQAEKTLAAFLKHQADAITEAQHEVLNELARALTERGWVQGVEAVVAKLGEHSSEDKVRAALADLITRRLVYVDAEASEFVGILGCLSVGRTDHRGHLESGTDVFTFGGMDLLTLPSLLLKEVDAFTQCPVTGKAIQLKLQQGQIAESNVNGIAGFIANWDGKGPLTEVAAHSPLFASDEALETWIAQHPDVKGTELPADLMLWVGMSAAQELAESRFKLIGHSE